MAGTIKDEKVTDAKETKNKRTLSIDYKIRLINKKIDKTQNALDELLAEKDKLIAQKEKEEAAKKKESVKKIIKELKDSGMSTDEIKALLD